MVTALGMLTLDQSALDRVEAALTFEEDGKALKRDLGQQLKQAVEPALPVIRSELMSMGGALDVQPGLRVSVGSALKSAVRYSGPAPGVRVSVSRKGMPRGFTSAPQRINQGAWSHPLWGRPGTSVGQAGVAGFFDRPLHDREGEMRDAVRQAIENMAQRIAARAG
jgi:hypothetical protein